MTLSPVIWHLIEAIAVLLITFYLLRRLIEPLFKPSAKAISYILNDALVTPAERSFLGCLDSVLPPEIRVFAKVRLADIFSVEDNQGRASWRSAFNRIQSKHVDFILCRSDDLSPLAAIELDDKSHDRNNRQERDKFLDELFDGSQIRLFRIKVQGSYNVRELALMLTEVFPR